ncbi:hypothetical protein nbrc107696_29420 [Gordonia spumicola]|uniref:Uncharacterized protein n=1 Tax=Gordonia spumicola TaxID=589161 RepID=A0A7I9VAU4_9ACTN|nr:hypothetical protein [Gordonia spumicola]GEE02496.1 hypothetical protein nbrc107696_29420 [Gordonia spumicola]
MDADADTPRDERDAQDRPDVSVRLGTTAAVVVLFLVLRLLAVAHWDWHVVAAIADTFDFSDAFPIAFGTVVGQPLLTGILIAVLLPLVLMRVLWPMDKHRGTITVSSVLGSVTLITMAISMTVTFGNPWTVVGAAAVGAAVIGMRLWWRTGVVHDTLLRLSRRVGVLTATGLLILAAVNDVPWMGEERIHTDTGVVEGYVLDAQPGFLHVLTHDREVVIIPDADVHSRELVD